MSGNALDCSWQTKKKQTIWIAVLGSRETVLENRAAFVTGTDIKRRILIGNMIICDLQGFGSSSILGVVFSY